MKIPVLAALALLALVKAHDVNDERRHHSAGRHLIHEVTDIHHVPDPTKEENPGDNSDVNNCGWKVFRWNGDCYSYCKDAEGNYKEVDRKWCGIGEERHRRKGKPSKCKKWKRKCRKCKRENKIPNDRASMQIFSTFMSPLH